MTFKGTNVTVDSAGTITMTAGGGTVIIEKTGAITLDSPAQDTAEKTATNAGHRGVLGIGEGGAT